MAVPAIFLRQCCGVYRVVASDRNAEPGCACPNNKRERGAFISQLCTEFRNEHFLAFNAMHEVVPYIKMKGLRVGVRDERALVVGDLSKEVCVFDIVEKSGEWRIRMEIIPRNRSARTIGVVDVVRH